MNYFEQGGASGQKLALQSAPLLIGHSLEWLKSPQIDEKNDSVAFLALLVLGTLGVAMLLWGTGQVDRDFFDRCVLGRSEST